jgi:PEGA domain-containing protein
MEYKEGKPREDVDTGVQADPPYWLRIVLRAALLGLVGIAAEAFLTQDWHSGPEFHHKLTETQPTTGYAMETTATKAAPAVNHPVAEVSPAATAPIAVDMIGSPLRSVADQPAALQLTTIPAGATFAVYPGIIADKAIPASAPLRTGIAPGTAEDLRGGNYTVFFHKEGWPDSRAEVQLQAGEVRPIEYAFFHGEVTITSVPSGAEILCGTVSLGLTPLTAALPAGNHVLTARLKNYPDRTQNVTVNENATSTIEFQMRVRRHIAKAKPTPTPSFLGKVGGSLKHLFGGDSTPPPRRKR